MSGDFIWIEETPSGIASVMASGFWMNISRVKKEKKKTKSFWKNLFIYFLKISKEANVCFNVIKIGPTEELEIRAA